MICVVKRPMVDAACAMSWVWFSGRDRTKWEGNITDRIGTTWNGLCWRSADSAWRALENFLLFHESSEDRKDVSVNRWVGAQTVEGEHEGYRDEGKTKVRHLR